MHYTAYKPNYHQSVTTDDVFPNNMLCSLGIVTSDFMNFQSCHIMHICSSTPPPIPNNLQLGTLILLRQSQVDSLADMLVPTRVPQIWT